MPECPNCKCIINYLIIKQTMFTTVLLEGNELKIVNKEYDDDVEYLCPHCNGLITCYYEEAVDFLTNKAEELEV